MIKKIFPTEFDLHNMSIRKTVSLPTAPGDQPDYKDVIVNKPWGYEYLLFENKYVAIWVLYLKQGAKTSMHCHPKKKTSLLVLDGEVKTSSLHTLFDLKTLDTLVIDRGVFHSTASEFSNGSFIMEIESPPDKADLVRLKDEYGRENQGYEGTSQFSRELEKYEYHGFHDHKDVYERKLTQKILKQKRNLILHVKEDWENVYNEIKQKEFAVLSFLDISIKDENGVTLLEPGDICEGLWFCNQYKKLAPSAKIFTVLTIY